MIKSLYVNPIKGEDFVSFDLIVTINNVEVYREKQKFDLPVTRHFVNTVAINTAMCFSESYPEFDFNSENIELNMEWPPSEEVQ